MGMSTPENLKTRPPALMGSEQGKREQQWQSHRHRSLPNQRPCCEGIPTIPRVPVLAANTASAEPGVPLKPEQLFDDAIRYQVCVCTHFGGT